MRFYSVIISASSLILLASALPVVQIAGVDEALFNAERARDLFYSPLTDLPHKLKYAAVSGSKVALPDVYKINEDQVNLATDTLDQYSAALVELNQMTHSSNAVDLKELATLTTNVKSSEAKMLEIVDKSPAIGIQVTHMAEDYLRLSIYASLKALSKEPKNVILQQGLQAAKDNLSGVLARRSQLLKDHPDLVAHFPEASVLQKNQRLIQNLELDQRIAKMEAGLIKFPNDVALLEEKASLIQTKAELLKFTGDAESIGWSVRAKVAMGMATILTFVGLPLGLVIGLSGSNPPMYQPTTSQSAVQGGLTTSSDFPISNAAGTTLALQ